MLDKQRKTHDIFGVLSEFGGFLKVLQSTFSIIVAPISYFLFLITMIKRMYFAKTTDDNIFLEPDKE